MATEKFMLRVQRGSLIPADGYTQRRMREKGYAMNDVLSATLAKPRNPQFHRLVHAFGKLVADNIEAFEGLDAHRVLKRLQIEANIACEEVPLNFPGIGPCTYRVPQSLWLSTKDDGQFKEVFADMCRHVSKTYWPTLTAEQIAEMAECMVDD